MNLKPIYSVLLLLFVLPDADCLTAQKLFPVEIKGKWGYMDAKGNMKINPRYDYAAEFNEGYAVVALNLLPCLIDSNEKRVIDTAQYEFLGTFRQGLCAARDYKFNYYYLDARGQKVISLPKDVYAAFPFYNGVARISKKVDEVEQKFGHDIVNLGYRFAYINRKGEFLCDFLYEDADDMVEDAARVKVKTKFGLIGKEGKEIIAPTYFNISSFSEGLAVADAGGKYGYVNTKGEQVIPATFDYCTMFNNGFAAFEANGKYGYINKEGKVVIEAKFDEVKPFGEGLAGVRTGTKWGFINDKGEQLMPPYYDNVAYFNEGLCPVNLKSRWGAIDKSGRLVVKMDFDYVSPFEDGLAQAVITLKDINIELYVDTEGNVLPKLR